MGVQQENSAAVFVQQHAHFSKSLLFQQAQHSKSAPEGPGDLAALSDVSDVEDTISERSSRKRRPPSPAAPTLINSMEDEEDFGPFLDFESWDFNPFLCSHIKEGDERPARKEGNPLFRFHIYSQAERMIEAFFSSRSYVSATPSVDSVASQEQK